MVMGLGELFRGLDYIHGTACPPPPPELHIYNGMNKGELKGVWTDTAFCLGNSD